MTTALLGDPASMSALGATMRRTAMQLSADAQTLSTRLADAGTGWRGPRALDLRRRTDNTCGQTAQIARALDESGQALQAAATELATAIAHLRDLEDAAAQAGLEVRDGAVTKGWGITGVADAHTVHDADRQRERLQERLHQTVTTLGRQRARLTSELTRASELLHQARSALRH